MAGGQERPVILSHQETAGQEQQLCVYVRIWPYVLPAWVGKKGMLKEGGTAGVLWLKRSVAVNCFLCVT